MKASTKIWSVVAIAITLFVCGDLVLSGCMSYFYHQSKYGIFHCQIYSLTESKEDVPILNFIESCTLLYSIVFKDSLGMTCLDSSSDGMCIYYHYVILSSYLALGHIPKLIIYDTNDFYSIHLSASTFTLETVLDRLALYYGEYLDIDFLYLE